jgi:hypothetical protein
MRLLLRSLPGRQWFLVLALTGSLAVALAATLVAPAFAGGGLSANPLLTLEPPDRHFERYDVGDKTVYFHERMLGDATVEGDFVNYQFDRASGSLLSRKTHWRDDLPADVPQAVITQEEAEAIVAGAAGGVVESSRLYLISPESAVLPIRPAPQNPCWVVRTTDGERPTTTVVDAVTGEVLGRGVPPPYGGFSFTGPWECPGSGDWRAWSQNAEAWFVDMGYDTDGVISPTLAKIRSHVKNDSTVMFYEIAHGGSTSFNFACVDDVWQSLAAFKIGVWIGAYAKMPFAFIASCDGMCDLGSSTFSYEFRKDGSVENTTTVGYCGMSSAACGACWSWSIEWQNALFNYMSEGWAVKAAFDQANADYPTCATNACMRFAGDETFAVVPVVLRDPEPPEVTVISPNGGETLEYGTQYEIRWSATDNARVTSVTLLLSTDGGASFPDTIATGEANDSSYTWTVPDVTSGTVRVRVVALDGVPNEGMDASDADFTLVGSAAGVIADRAGAPDGVVLEVAGENPASSGWRLIYGLPAASSVRLGVYDVSGRLIERLVDARRESGYHHIDWNPGASDAPVGPGVYFLRLDCDAGSATAKAVVAR